MRRDPSTTPAQDAALWLARHLTAVSLASALADPRCPLARRTLTLDPAMLATAWVELLDAWHAQPDHALAPGERHPVEARLEPLLDWLTLRPTAREEPYVQTFGLTISRHCPPYETEYCPSKDITQRAQRLADIAGFYRAFGVEPAGEPRERPDHVALELEFIALLHEKRLRAASPEHRQLCDETLSHFVRDHSSRWVAGFGQQLARRAEQFPADPASGPGPRTFAGIAHLLSAWAAIERALCGVPATPGWSQPRPLDEEPPLCEDGCPLAGRC